MRTSRSRHIGLIAVAVFLLAFVVRLVWILRVQSPFDAVYSDMGGYVSRAEDVLAHRLPADPQVQTIYPYGTHAILALEFMAFGRNGRGPITVIHALVGALPAACMVLFTAKFASSRALAVLVGVVLAFWQPQIWTAGFFLSEIWFSAAIALHAVWAVREPVRRKSLFGMSCAAALAFVVRPQFIMTWAIEAFTRMVALARRRGPWTAARQFVWLALPLALTIAFSAVRMHQLSGRWGLISSNGAISRVWADTSISKLEASWRIPNGGRFAYWFNPPSKPIRSPSDVVRFEGFIADPEILAAIRHKRLRGVPFSARLARWAGNVGLLVAGNLPWPESNYTTPFWRGALERGFAVGVLFAMLPLAFLGLLFGPRNRGMVVIVANLVTCVFAAAVYFGEARYHIPYDLFALPLAAVGARAVWRGVRRFARWLLRRLTERSRMTALLPRESLR